MSTTIFISHREAETETAELLVDFLYSSLELKDGSVRCTSVPGHQLEFGATVAEQLKRDISTSTAVFAILTPDALESKWVQFESGASWALSKVIIPLLGPGLRVEDLPGPLKEYTSIEIGAPTAENRLRDAVRQISKVLGVAEKTGGKSQQGLERFIRAMRQAEVSSGVGSEAPGAFAEDTRAGLRFYFLAGCGVGNRVAVLPLTPDTDEGRTLQEFIEALDNIGLKEHPIVQPIVHAGDRLIGLPSEGTGIGSDELKRICQGFFDAIQKVPDLVRARASIEQFQWFKFGQYLYEIILSGVTERGPVKGHLVKGMGALAQEMTLPAPIRSQVQAWLEEARKGADVESLMPQANDIALTVFSLL